MRKLVISLVLLLGLLSAVVLSDRPAPRADFVFANGSDPTTLDPQRMSWMPDLRIARLLYEPLVKHDVLTTAFEFVPGVAESWDVSDDGRTYTFHLRNNAKWSNGEPVRAQDFVFSWRRAMLPDLASDYFEMFMFVEGARAFYDWRADKLASFADDSVGMSASERARAADALWAETKARFDETVGMSTPDDRTLVVTLAEPVPYFLDLCAFMVFAPVYPPLVERYEQPDPQTARLVRRSGWTKAGVLIGNGPFVLERWAFKRGMRFGQNPHYWNRESLAVRTIGMPSIEDPNAAVMAFETGAVDFVADVSASYRGELIAGKLAFLAEHAAEVDRLREEGLDQFEVDRRLPADPRKHAHAVTAFGTYFYNFNCRETLADGRANPFADARVRRAFAMVIDKRAITDRVRRLGEKPASTLIPPGSIRGYESPAGLPNISTVETQAERDAIVAEARRLLGDAGYDDPAEFPTVELLFNKDAGHDLIAQVVARSWQEHLGVKTRLAQKELQVYRVDLKAKNYMTSRAGWFGDYGDPTTFLNLSRSGDGNNDRGYSSERYDALLGAAAAERDPDRRLEILAEAERVIMEEDVPMVPIFHYAWVYLFDPAQVTGISAHPRTKQVLGGVDVLGDGVGPDEPRPMRTPTAGRGALDGEATP